MNRWEYCQIVQPLAIEGKLVAPLEIIYFGPSKDRERREDIEDVGIALARLGEDGWELVSHTQTFTLLERNIVLPVANEYHLKRQAKAA